ncbi:MAG: hypothetical protein BWX86_02023 [Verrucomicrobia bacterium ADurb.Bin122]|nr:MAG: hypothetical protein BWX86_02023 [Verrucomicrobia bacterium ADurb.Bin122]
MPVHAVENEARGLAVDRHDALGAVERLGARGDEVVYPALEEVHVERAGDGEGDGADLVRVFRGVLALVETVAAGHLALDAREVEAAEVEHLVGGHEGFLGREIGGGGVDLAQALQERGNGIGRHEVGLVDEDGVGVGDLFGGVAIFAEVGFDVRGIDDGDDAVEPVARAQVFFGGEGVGEHAGVGDAGGLDEEPVDGALGHRTEAVDELDAGFAAGAALHDFQAAGLGAAEQLVVDGDLAELVFEDGDAVLVLAGEQVAEQGGFPCAEKTGEDRDNNGLRGSVGHGALEIGVCPKSQPLNRSSWSGESRCISARDLRRSALARSRAAWAQFSL